ncbi:MAG: hypothetical protein ABIS36_17895 [Chryseolinea sp.]
MDLRIYPGKSTKDATLRLSVLRDINKEENTVLMKALKDHLKDVV